MITAATKHQREHDRREKDEKRHRKGDLAGLGGNKEANSSFGPKGFGSYLDLPNSANPGDEAEEVYAVGDANAELDALVKNTEKKGALGDISPNDWSKICNLELWESAYAKKRGGKTKADSKLTSKRKASVMFLSKNQDASPFREARSTIMNATKSLVSKVSKDAKKSSGAVSPMPTTRNASLAKKESAVSHAEAAAAQVPETVPFLKSIREANFADFYINPTNFVYKLWEFWIIICVFWNAVMLPMQLAFPEKFLYDPTIKSFDALTDTCFILDLIINFFTAYIDDWGSLITDRKRIAQMYLSKWFWVDLPACLPFEHFVPASEAIAVSMIKCVRLLRIGKVLKYMDRFRFANFARILRLFMFLMLVCHWIGCLWFFIGNNWGLDDCSDWPGYFDASVNSVKFKEVTTLGDLGWYGPFPMGVEDEAYAGANATAFCSWLSVNRIGNATVATKYVKSLYWAVTTITSVGYGDIVPVTDIETLFAIFIMILGAGIYAMIFSNFVSYVSRIDAANSKYSEKMEEIRNQMRYLRLPPELQGRVEQYFEYVWQCHKGLLEKDNYFFEELPMPLHVECAEFLHMETLGKNPLFRGCSRSFLREIVVRLKPQIATPNQYIIHKGSSAKAIYFIERGDVEVLKDSNSGEVIGELTAGDYFGDVAILACKKRTASVRATTFCDLFFLLADDLHMLLEMYDADAKVVAQNVMNFLTGVTVDDAQDRLAFTQGFRSSKACSTVNEADVEDDTHA